MKTGVPTENNATTKIDLPHDWKWMKLGDVCDIINGKNQKDVIDPDGKYPIYGSSGIFGYSKEYLSKGGSTIVGRKGTINNPIYVSTDFWNVDTAFALTPNESVDGKFLFYFCRAFNFHTLDKSTTIPSLAKRDLLAIDFILPPKEEQKAIVSKIEELFSELDKGKQQLETAKQQLKIYRQAVLKWAFEGKLSELGRVGLKDVRITGLDTRKEILPSTSPKNPNSDSELPEGWRRVTIADVCEMKAGFFIKAAEIMEEFNDGLFPCYGGNGLRGYVKSSTHDGTFPLVGRQGALCGNVHLVSGKFYATEHAVVVTPKEGYDVKWLYHKLISMRLSQYSTGTAQPGLSVNKLLPIELSVPSIQEQQFIAQEIESRLSVCDKVEETINQSLAQAETLRQSILKKAFEGKLV